MASFSTSLSGLKANALALSVIANNLANLNTVAYKEMSPIFGDLFYQQVGTNGAGNPIQVGVGSSVSSIAAPFTQGSIDSTGVPTDVAIQGSGFFVVLQNGKQIYTRAGNFSVDSKGFLVNNDGGQVLGYPAAKGVISPSQTLAPLTISGGQVSMPQPTANMSLTMNLDASAAISTATGSGTPPVSFSTPLVVYDSLGMSHVLTFNFTKSAANTWDFQVTVPAAEVGNKGAPVSVGSGTLNFDSAGKLTTPTAANPVKLKLAGLADGAADLDLLWQPYDSSGTPLVTQAAGASQTSATRQDGYGGGTLLSFNIGPDGSIHGVFSNGQNTALGQLALASFPNPEGLARDGGNGYRENLSSGLPNIGAPGTAGRGTVRGGALESSNVDVATEFAGLIKAQRGYQANARVITVADEVTQEAINLKR